MTETDRTPLPDRPADEPPTDEPPTDEPPTDASPTAGRPTDEAAVPPRRRLHPLSPLLNGARTFVVIVGAISLSQASEFGWQRFGVMLAVISVGAVVFSLVNWANTGYHVVGRELRIHEGLFWRRTRAIPLERLQTVEVRRPLLAQLTGLAELRLEVVGGGKTEAPLAFLTVADAEALRERLVHLSGRVHDQHLFAGTDTRVTPGAEHPGTPSAVAAPTAYPRADRDLPLHAVRNADLVLSQVLTPQTFFLPLGVASVLVQFSFAGNFNLVAIFSTLAAVGGVMLAPARRVLNDWGFRLWDTPLNGEGRGLRMAYGLLETRNQTVPLHRLQAVTVTWPLFWRAKSWLRVRFSVAGVAGPGDGNEQQSDRLLPVGDPETGRRLVALAMPGLDLATVRVQPPPARVRWLHPFAWSRMGVGLNARVLTVTRGVVTRELVAVPYTRIQSVRVVQGPLQRRLRLATVHVDTAGGAGAEAPDRDIHEAWALAAALTARAHAAQAAATGS
ncbi:MULTISPECIES: PH domain-containing protein [Catenuloplanes]|uniref:Membrane protein n=1 Tax=Catenuloplanes niger TaxID=587534 RepID=A0AAE3ZK20_9ACTN|nr:PH domain-containing protein [Catenuloplanes niger]MDR7321348.1 putative membrane protein [Catenuloplanes niger]